MVFIDVLLASLLLPHIETKQGALSTTSGVVHYR